MMISEFARTTGLSRETVRFYVRLGLLRPTSSGKGGIRPYQLFTSDDIQAAEVIRVGQLLGMSLKEIASLDTERREHGIPPDRLAEILKGQLVGLEAKAAELNRMIRFVRAKIEWLSDGRRGPHPSIAECGYDIPSESRF